MAQKLIFTAILGAVIGYITNWLAIKMLFKPHYEKKIFGIKVPFTPGLIPKEQSRIARSIGDAIGTHLLTNDTMIEALRTNGVNKKFKKWIKNKVIEIQNSSLSIGDQIKNIVGAGYNNLVLFIKQKLVELIMSTIKKDKFKKELEEIIVKSVKKELSKNPKEILEKESYKKLKENVIFKLKTFKDSKEFNDSLTKLLDDKVEKLRKSDKTLEDVIPASFVSSIKVYVYNKNYDIAMLIKDMLEDERIKDKLKDAIKSMVSSNLNPMIAMFLNADVIYEKIISVVNGELDKEDTQKTIALLINDVLDKMIKEKISNVFSNTSDDSKQRNIKSICNVITDKVLDDKLLNDTIMLMENKIISNESIEEILNDLNLDYEELLRKFVRNKVEGILENEQIEQRLDFYIENSVNKVLAISFSEISISSDKNIPEIVGKEAEAVFDRFITNKAGDFIEAFNIKKIVEDKINSFDVAFAEKIILEIASKELSAITWIGALLGSIMGLLSTLIANI